MNQHQPPQQLFDPGLFPEYNFDYYGNSSSPQQQAQAPPASQQDFLRVPSPFDAYLSDSSYGSNGNEDDSRKKRRNLQEKKRREQLNLSIDSFRDLIPPEIVYGMTKDTGRMNDKISRHQLVDCTKQYIEILRQTVFEQHQYLQQRNLHCQVSSPIEIDALVGRKRKPLQSLDRSLDRKSESTPMVSVTAASLDRQPLPMPEPMEQDQVAQYSDHQTLAALITRLNDNLRVMYMMLKDAPHLGYWIHKAIERCQDLTGDVLNYHQNFRGQR